MAISDKIDELNHVKDGLVSAIRNKGGTVGSETLRGCVDAIDTIPTGGGEIILTGDGAINKLGNGLKTHIPYVGPYVSVAVKTDSGSRTIYTVFSSGYASTSYYHRAYTATATSSTPAYSSAAGRVSTSPTAYPRYLLTIGYIKAGDTVYIKTGTSSSSTSFGTWSESDPHFTVPNPLPTDDKIWSDSRYIELLVVLDFTSTTTAGGLDAKVFYL